MVHACFISFVLCFVYTLMYFYTLSRTNLLTRCHSACCLFSTVFGFKKLKNEYSQNWTGQNPKFIFFSERYGKSKTRRRRTQGWPHPRWARAHPGRAHRGCGPLSLHRPCLLRLLEAPTQKP